MNNWEKQFDKKFARITKMSDGLHYKDVLDRNKVKQFIKDNFIPKSELKEIMGEREYEERIKNN